MKRVGMAILAAPLGGCILAAAVVLGAAVGGTYAYVSGESRAEFRFSGEKVKKGVDAVIQRRGLRKEGESFDAVSGGWVRAKDGRDTTVQFTISPKTQNTCTLGVRYGGIGDRTISDMYLQDVDKELQK